MKKLLIVLLAISATVAFAGDYVFSELLYSFMGEDSINYELLDGTTDGYLFSPHGSVVDLEGKLWIGFNHNYTRQFECLNGDTIRTRGIYIFNADGTQATFSPIEFLEFDDGSKDTIFAESYANGGGLGITMMDDGSILYTSWGTLYKIDYLTGEGIARWYPKMESSTYALTSLTEAAHDPVQEMIFITSVAPGNKIWALDEDLAFIAEAAEGLPQYHRSIVARTKTDGTGQIFAATTWTGSGIFLLESDDPEFESYVVVDTVGNVETTSEDTAVTFVAWAECLDWVDVDNGILLYGAYTTQVIKTLKVKKPDILHKSDWVIYDVDNKVEIASFGKYYPAAPANEAGLILPVNEDVPADSLGGQPMSLTPRGATVEVDGDYYKFTINDYDLGTVQTVEWDAGTAIGNDRYVPYGFALEQNYPNPFNPTTSISFNIPENFDVSVDVYDLGGAKVATVYNGYMEAGSHNMTFDASDLASGTYLYKLTAGNLVVSRKMTLVK